MVSYIYDIDNLNLYKIKTIMNFLLICKFC